MDSKIKEYRKKHKRCKWCKYYKHIIEQWGTSFYSYDKCRLKEKTLEYYFWAKLCKYYQIKEEEKYEI